MMPISMCQDVHCPNLIYNEDLPVKHTVTEGCVDWETDPFGAVPIGAAVLEPIEHQQRIHTIDGIGRLGDPGCLLALPTSLGGSHGGGCYTLVTRVERGFGFIGCGREGCNHEASKHVHGEFATPCAECNCPVWVESADLDDITGTEYAAKKAPVWEGVIPGMGPDAVTIQNANGASQSAIPLVFTTMPLRALAELAKLQKYGDEKYGAHNWRGISEADHLDHAFAHVLAHQLGDLTDDHLIHAAWRLLAAVEANLTIRDAFPGGNE